EHLDLDASSALALLRRGLVPDDTRAGQGFDGFARAMQLLEAVAAAEETEVVGGEGEQRAIIPAQRLGPLLLPLEEPSDRAVEDRGAPRRELSAALEVPLELVLVAEHPERPADLEEQLRALPRVVLREVVDRSVALDDRLMVTPISECPHFPENLAYVPHPAVPPQLLPATVGNTPCRVESPRRLPIPI